MDNKVLIKIVRSDNKMFVLGDDTWKIPSDGLEGFGDYENIITTTENPLLDGETFENERIGKKDRTITGICVDNNEIHRHKATSFFIPKMEYDIYITYKGRERWARGRLLKFNCPSANIWKRTQFSVTFLFANPYFNSVDNFGRNIADIIPMAGFPYISVALWGGQTSGKYNFKRTVSVNNDGDVQTDLKVEMIAKGSCVNPSIIINDKFVKLNDELIKNDLVIIDFSSNPPTVKKNGINIIGKCDRQSTFDDMHLRRGANNIWYNADNGSSNIEVSLYYNKKYVTI